MNRFDDFLCLNLFHLALLATGMFLSCALNEKNKQKERKKKTIWSIKYERLLVNQETQNTTKQLNKTDLNTWIKRNETRRNDTDRLLDYILTWTHQSPNPRMLVCEHFCKGWLVIKKEKEGRRRPRLIFVSDIFSYNFIHLYWTGFGFYHHVPLTNRIEKVNHFR